MMLHIVQQVQSYEMFYSKRKNNVPVENNLTQIIVITLLSNAHFANFANHNYNCLLLYSMNNSTRGADKVFDWNFV